MKKEQEMRYHGNDQLKAIIGVTLKNTLDSYKKIKNFEYNNILDIEKTNKRLDFLLIVANLNIIDINVERINMIINLNNYHVVILNKLERLLYLCGDDYMKLDEKGRNYIDEINKTFIEIHDLISDYVLN